MSHTRSALVILAQSTAQEDSAELATIACKRCVAELQKRDVTVDLIDLDAELEFTPFDSNADLSTKIVEYQLRINRADCIIIFHPTKLYGVPGILKAWLDEVFSNGFAYSRRRGMISPMLKEKPVHVWAISNAPSWEIRFIHTPGLLHFWNRTLPRMTGVTVQTQLFGSARSNRESLEKKLLKKAVKFAHSLTSNFIPPEELMSN